MSLGFEEGEEEHARSRSPPTQSIYSIWSNRLYSEFDSTKTMQLHIRKYTKLLLNPEKLSNRYYQALIHHTTKNQFLKFIAQLQGNMKFWKDEVLNMHAFFVSVKACKLLNTGWI